MLELQGLSEVLALTCSSGWSGAAPSREGAGSSVLSLNQIPSAWDPGSPPHSETQGDLSLRTGSRELSCT